MGRRYVKLERNQGSLIQNWYSCATCWSSVRVCHDKDGDYITCGEDSCRCNGLVRTSTINYIIQNHELLAREAREVLQVQFEWLRLPKRKRLPTKQNLEELGF